MPRCTHYGRWIRSGDSILTGLCVYLEKTDLFIGGKVHERLSTKEYN